MTSVDSAGEMGRAAVSSADVSRRASSQVDVVIGAGASNGCPEASDGRGCSEKPAEARTLEFGVLGETSDGCPAPVRGFVSS